MRPTTFVMTVFIGCGIPSIAACQSAVAAPLPQVAGGALGASVIETVGYWKRYCRYNDCSGTPNVVVVPTPTPAAVPAVPTAPVVVPQSPPVIAVVPCVRWAAANSIIGAARLASTPATTILTSARDRT